MNDVYEGWGRITGKEGIRKVKRRNAGKGCRNTFEFLFWLSKDAVVWRG